MQWSLGISAPQHETGAAGMAHFEPGGVAFQDTLRFSAA
jgi:hypothetical protein